VKVAVRRDARGRGVDRQLRLRWPALDVDVDGDAVANDVPVADVRREKAEKW
jgi:hypothetical protein